MNISNTFPLFFIFVFAYSNTKSMSLSVFPNLSHNQISIPDISKNDHFKLKLLEFIISNLSSDFALTIHFDNRSLDFIENFMVNMKIQKLICGIYNYDNFSINKSENSNCLIKEFHVILLDDSKSIKNMKTSDTLFLFNDKNSNTKDSNKLFDTFLLTKAFSTFHLQTNDSITTLYETCLYCGNLSEKMTKLIKIQSKTEIESFRSITSQINKSIKLKFTSFDGHIFKILANNSLSFCKKKITMIKENLIVHRCVIDQSIHMWQMYMTSMNMLNFSVETFARFKLNNNSKLVGKNEDHSKNLGVGFVPLASAYQGSYLSYMTLIVAGPIRGIYFVEPKSFLYSGEYSLV